MRSRRRSSVGVQAARARLALLDEVGELTPATQARVLRVLESSELLRVGEVAPRPVDVRVLAEEPPLDVPITAFGGEQDHFVPIAGVRGWGRHTTAELTFEARPGGHHLSDDDEARLASVLHQRLSPR